MEKLEPAWDWASRGIQAWGDLDGLEELIFPSLMGHRFQNRKKKKQKPKHDCVKDFLIHWHILNLQYYLLSSYWMPGLSPRYYEHWVEQMDKHYASRTCGKRTMHKVSNWKREGVLIALSTAEKETQGREADVWSPLGWSFLNQMARKGVQYLHDDPKALRK